MAPAVINRHGLRLIRQLGFGFDLISMASANGNDDFGDNVTVLAYVNGDFAAQVTHNALANRKAQPAVILSVGPRFISPPKPFENVRCILCGKIARFVADSDGPWEKPSWRCGDCGRNRFGGHPGFNFDCMIFRAIAPPAAVNWFSNSLLYGVEIKFVTRESVPLSQSLAGIQSIFVGGWVFGVATARLNDLGLGKKQT